MMCFVFLGFRDASDRVSNKDYNMIHLIPQ